MPFDDVDAAAQVVKDGDLSDAVVNSVPPGDQVKSVRLPAASSTTHGARDLHVLVAGRAIRRVLVRHV